MSPLTWFCRRYRFLIPLVIVIATSALPVLPAQASKTPLTLAANAPVGAAPVAVAFPIEFLGVTWHGDEGTAYARLLVRGVWSRWQPLAEDGAQTAGTFGTALLPAQRATAYQVRVPGGVRAARAVAINVHDGTSEIGVPTDTAGAATSYVSRAAWGADESLRFSGGTESWPATYYPLQKTTVHHTATTNADPDPAATVRAIYRYHAIDRGWGDIGYQYLVDEQGRVYEGRWSGTDTDVAHDAAGNLVTAAHVAGANSGNAGIALLGTLSDAGPTAAAQSAAEGVLADLAARHQFDPHGTSMYTNPVNGSTKSVANISGHRDWEATDCPGGVLYARLPEIRDHVAARSAPPPAAQITLAARGYKVKKLQKAELTWSGASTVDVYRNGVLIAAGVPGTSYVDNINRTGRATYLYRVRAGDVISNEAKVVF